MRKLQELGLQIEDCSLIVHLGRGEVERIAGTDICTDIQCEARRYFPVVADEKFGNVRAQLNHLRLVCRGRKDFETSAAVVTGAPVTCSGAAYSGVIAPPPGAVINLSGPNGKVVPIERATRRMC